MATVTVAECEPPNNEADAVNNCGQPDSGQRRPTAATQTDGQPQWHFMLSLQQDGLYGTRYAGKALC